MIDGPSHWPQTTGLDISDADPQDVHDVAQALRERSGQLGGLDKRTSCFQVQLSSHAYMAGISMRRHLLVCMPCTPVQLYIICCKFRSEGKRGGQQAGEVAHVRFHGTGQQMSG